jgi:hypothetical protein
MRWQTKGRAVWAKVREVAPLNLRIGKELIIMLYHACLREHVQYLLVVISGPSLRRENKAGFVPIPLSVEEKEKRESSSLRSGRSRLGPLWFVSLLPSLTEAVSAWMVLSRK